MTTCGKCQEPIDVMTAEICWFCEAWLCYKCWDKYSHCGHEEADKINKEARERYDEMESSTTELEETTMTICELSCGKCKKPIDAIDAEVCWFCDEPLCVDCWKDPGHCGHEEITETQAKYTRSFLLGGDKHYGSLWPGELDTAE